MAMRLRHYLIAGSLFVSCACTNVPAQVETPGFEAARREMAEALQQRDELLALTCDILEATTRIKQLEHMLAVGGQGKNERARIMQDIAAIESELHSRRERIAHLERSLENSQSYSAQLQSSLMVMNAEINARIDEAAALRLTLDEANGHISSLKGEVETLNRDVKQKEIELSETRGRAYLLSKELCRAQGDAASLLNEANTCYYVVADLGCLKRHNVVQGGFLRRTKLLPSDFDRGLFLRADKRTLSAIPVAGSKVKVLTTHPLGSYHLEITPEGILLCITDREDFWSISNYLVIQSD